MSKNNTPCKNCSFAIYEDVTQVGCSRGMIDKYRENGDEVLEAYDEDREFFVIIDRICPFYRDEKWRSKFDDFDSMERALKMETTLSINLIIVYDDSNSIGDILKTIQSLNVKESRTSPAQITIIKKLGAELDPKELERELKGVPVLWRIESLLVEMDDIRLVHGAQKTINTQYYSTCDAGYQFPEGYFSKINDAVIDDLVIFGMVKPEESYQGVLIPKHVHQYWYFKGDVNKTIPENIEEYQCQNPEEKVVLKFNDLKS